MRSSSDLVFAPHVVISGWYGQQNIGDDAMLEVLLREMQQRFPRCRFTILSEAPDLVRSSFGGRFPIHCLAHPSIYGVKKLLDRDRRVATRKVWSCVRTADLFILGGGSLIRDHNPSNFLRLMDELFVARLAGVPTAPLGVSIGPLRSSWSRYLTRELLESALLVTVRDQESSKLLSAIGVSDAKVRIAGDLALLLHADANAKKEHRAGVAICPCNAMLTGLPDGPPGNMNLVRILAEVCVAIDAELSEPITLVPFRQNVEGDDDLKLATEIRRHSGLGQALRIASGLSVSETAGLLSRSRLVIGARFHALVFAISHGVPVIGIAYGQKTQRFLEDIGCAEFCFRPADIIADDLIRVCRVCLQTVEYEQSPAVFRLHEAASRLTAAIDQIAMALERRASANQRDQ